MAGKYTTIMRQAFDVGRRELKLPDTIELLKRDTAAPTKGGYLTHYTVTKGWLLYHFNEMVDGSQQRLVALLVTDDRSDFDDIKLRLIVAAKVIINGRTKIYNKKTIRPSVSGDPAYFQVILDPTGELIT